MTERFRCVLGVSPKAYARLCRFEHAASLLDGLHDGSGPLTHVGRRRHRGRLLRPVPPHPGLRRAGRHDAGGLPGRLPRPCPRSGLSKTHAGLRPVTVRT